ncbi:MAG: leucine-rich repeat domain-containing protein [Clostridia bacterium]|nr:leucine-rich repeat domain-containing protein [Clostridia bacterium]
MRELCIKKTVAVCICIFSILVIFASCDTDPTSGQAAAEETSVTAEQIEETLHEGMWYVRIVEFIGKEGTRLEGEDIVYEWALSDGKLLRVTFEHPRCGLSVLPDEYYLKRYYIFDTDKHGECCEPNYDDNKHIFDDFDLPNIEEVSYMKIGIHDGRLSINIEDKDQIAKIYEYMQAVEAYPCGTTQGYYGVMYPITIFSGSREYYYTIIGNGIFTVTGAESIGRYSELFMTYDLDPLVTYLDVLVAEYQIECVVGEYRADSEKQKLVGDGVEISPNVLEYWLYDGRKIHVTYDAAGEGQDPTESNIVSFEIVGDASNIPERVESQVPRLTSVDGVLYCLSEDERFYTVCGVDLLNVKSKLKLEDYIHGLPVRKISSGAFRFADSVTEIIISDTVKEIKSGAIYYCNNLEKIYIPASVEKIGLNAFQDCDNLTVECEVTERPEGWDEHWNSDRFGRNPCDVIWGR